MNQYPPNPYGNSNPNDQTIPYNYTPGQYYPAPPPPPVKRRRKMWNWYRGQRKRTQWGLGCGVLIAALFLCICSAALAAPSAGQTANSPTPTTAAQAVVATARPTATPRPAETPTPKPTPKPTAAPTQPPVPTAAPKPTNPCQNAVNNNPWCYDFNPGNLITSPPSNFCDYFNCIPTFVSTDDPDGGYIVECSDGTYSQSGGESGSCSHHGGNMRALYSH